ncbi:hypothetical protein N9089_05190 [Crocinitomicaceae bacterium]|nr:hypothetical protein [Crocinitomicaceae bacterium]
MAFKFFRVSAHNLDSAADELNRFLSSNHVDSIERQFVDRGESPYWLFCIEYQEERQAKSPATSTGTRRKERVDYREHLNDEDFQTYLGLKELRVRIADEEKLAVYLIFTNEHLAKIADAVGSEYSADIQTPRKSGVHSRQQDESRTTFGVAIAVAEPLLSISTLRVLSTIVAVPLGNETWVQIRLRMNAEGLKANAAPLVLG